MALKALMKPNSRNADCLPELRHLLHDRPGLGRGGRPFRALRALQVDLVCRLQERCRAATAVSAPAVSAFVDGVIAEAEAESNATRAPQPQTHRRRQHRPTPTISAPRRPAIFRRNPAAEQAPAPFDSASQNNDLAPHADETFAEPADEPAVAMENAPSLVPADEHDAFAAGNGQIEHNAELDAEEAESFVARRQRLKAKRQKSKRNSRWTAIVLVLFAFNVALIGARNDLVRYLPQTASLFSAIGLPVNLRNLKFDKVKITKETTDGVSILVIEGMIVNTANKPTDVPRLRFSARNEAGRDVYTWTMQPARPVLGPGESMEFHSRLAAPPSDAHDVMVRFFTAQDAATGAK